MILAFGTTAPEASVTVPVIVPRSNWARPDVESSMTAAAIRNTNFIYLSSCAHRAHPFSNKESDCRSNGEKRLLPKRCAHPEETVKGRFLGGYPSIKAIDSDR